MEHVEAGRAHRLGRNAIHTSFDNALPPRLTVAPGDEVTFATREASGGWFARDVAAARDPGADPELVALVAASAEPAPPPEPGGEPSGHPLTGPVAVAGAEPGDALAVEVVSVVPGAWGWTACGPGSGGLLRDALPEWTRHLWDLRAGDSAPFAPGIRVPLAPFCGVMGVAPAEPRRHSTVTPRPAGGNLDLRQLTAGATLFLPVLVPRALFSVGDAHAAQGAGEVAGTGIETDATATLRFRLLKGRRLPGPSSWPRRWGRRPAPGSPPRGTAPTSTRPRARRCAACWGTSGSATGWTGHGGASWPAPASTSALAKPSTPGPTPSALSCH